MFPIKICINSHKFISTRVIASSRKHIFFMKPSHNGDKVSPSVNV